jgi:GT2 family glycosyltransferase
MSQTAFLMTAESRLERLRERLTRGLAHARRDTSMRPVDIIVPLYNAVEQTLSCLESVAAYTTFPYRLIVIDDASSDIRVGDTLAALTGLDADVIAVRHACNAGFVASANEGMRMSHSHDVVLLNSDTVVTARWLEKLAAVSRSRPGVATVTPLTNNGTICSVPEPGGSAVVPGGYNIDTFAALVEETSFALMPEAPTGVGFCLYISRAALHDVGLLDADAFPRGYGEENDFCQRAIARGYVNLIADDTFVYHAGRASFGSEADDRLERNLRILCRRHPGYLRAVRRHLSHDPLDKYRHYLRACVSAGRRPRHERTLRVLHVLHQGGGTERHVRDLASNEDPDVISYVMTTNGEQLSVDEYSCGHVLRTLLFRLAERRASVQIQSVHEYQRHLARIFVALQLDLIHIHHFRYHGVDAAAAAVSSAIPYVVTLHDYFALCPTYTLINSEGAVCADCRRHEAGEDASECMRAIGQPAGFLLEYQRSMFGVLRAARRLFVPNVSVREVFSLAYPDIANRIVVLEHGHRAAPASGRVEPPAGQLDVALIGGIEFHKGAGILRALLAENQCDDIVFHLYGTTTDVDVLRLRKGRRQRLDGSWFVYHGPYDADDIVGLLIRDRIQLGLQLAIWPETFSYTLSEFVQAGIPVIAADIGAQGERTRRHALGWVLPSPWDVRALVALLEQLRTSPSEWIDVRERMDRQSAVRPLATAWKEYVEAYRHVIASGAAGRELEPATLAGQAVDGDRAFLGAHTRLAHDGYASAGPASIPSRAIQLIRQHGIAKVVRLAMATAIGEVRSRFTV